MGAGGMALTLITGCPRSGTTLVTSVLAAHGARIGRVNVLNEQTVVRDRLIKPYLRSIGADPLGQSPLPDTERLTPVDGWRQQVLQALDGADTYKGAKMCLMWPVWAHAFPDARWIVVRRDADAIADSCMRTNFMRAFDTHAQWRRYAEVHEERFAQMRRANLNICEVWPDPGDPQSFRPAVEHAGYAFNAAKTRACVDPDKWKQPA